MPSYRYRAKNAQGKLQSGFVQAKDPEDARLRIEGRGLMPMIIEPAQLKKKQQLQDIPTPTPKRNIALVLVFLLMLAGVAFCYFDPFGLFDLS